MRNGRIELPEENIQIGLEEILNIPFHKKDWDGEQNDLYTIIYILTVACVLPLGARREKIVSNNIFSYQIVSFSK